MGKKRFEVIISVTTVIVVLDILFGAVHQHFRGTCCFCF